MKWLLRTTVEERAWQRANIARQSENYLATDVLEKVSDDPGYRQKIELICGALEKHPGWILDVGSGTAGECEYLKHQGYKVIATDVNDTALALSVARCERFGRRAPAYVACDGQLLPFGNETVDCVIYNESLHHMPQSATALTEAARVLRPGGIVVLYEPYAYDPWRRISEVRDYLRGTIETSFSIRQIRRLLTESGFLVTAISRPVLDPSSQKLAQLPMYRRLLRRAYYSTRQVMPGLLGMIFCIGQKKRIYDSGARIDSGASERHPAISATPNKESLPASSATA